MPVEQALEKLGERSKSRLMAFLVASIGVAVKSGADLIPQLVVIEETVRQRARIEGKIKAAIALAKPTSYLAMFTPVGMGGWLFLSDPTYGKFYFGEGWLMLLIAVVLYAAGVFTVRLMVSNVEKV